MRSVTYDSRPRFGMDSTVIREGFANGFANGFAPEKTSSCRRRWENGLQTARESFANEIALDALEPFGQSIKDGDPT